MQRIENPDDYYDPNVVKVVVTQSGQAMYFSRSCLPGNLGQEWSTQHRISVMSVCTPLKRSCLMDFIH